MMNKVAEYLLSCFLILCSCAAFAQNGRIDSLLTLLKTDKDDTDKLAHLNYISREYDEMSSYDTALLYADSALAVSDIILKNKPDPKTKRATEKWRGASYSNIGNVNVDQGNRREALENYLISLKIRQTIDDKKGIATCYNNIGNVNTEEGNYPEALKNLFASLKISESIGDGDKTAIARSYGNIGNVYYAEGNFPEALRNYRASLKMKQALGDQKGVATDYGNIGFVYSAEGNYGEALKNQFASLKIRKMQNDKAGLAYAYNGIGVIYYSEGNVDNAAGDKVICKEEYAEALRNFFSSLQLSEEIGDKASVNPCYINIGSVYLKQGKYPNAEEYLTKAKELSREIDDRQGLRDTYAALTELDSTTGNFKDAFENNKLYILYRDSIDNEETRRKTIQSQMTFDFEKKEAIENAEQKKELENQSALADEKSHKQKIVIGFVLFGLLLVIVFSVFLFNRFRITQKQKLIIENQKSIVEEKQKEILDSIHYARRIQNSLFPTEKYIERSLTRLKGSD